jgi:hypothetical protein
VVRHDFQCETCDLTFEADVEVEQLPAGPPCKTCQSSTVRVFLPPASRWTPDAVVVYRAPDGSFRFPGDTGGISAAKYDRLGYERIEARGFAEVRTLERRLNAHEQSQLRRAEDRRLEYAEHVDSQRRSEIRRQLDQGFRIPETVLRGGQVVQTGRMTTVHLSARGRDAMRAAAESNDRKGHRRIGETGIHVDAYSNTRSNRDESRGADGRRRRD